MKDIFCRTAKYELSLNSMCEGAHYEQIGARTSRIGKESHSDIWR